MVHVQHGSLRALEEHRPPCGQRVVQIARRVGNQRTQPFPDPGSSLQHLPPVERGSRRGAIPFRDVGFNQRRETAPGASVGQVADAYSATAGLVLIARSDATRGRADALRPEPVLGHRLEVTVIGEDDVRAAADEQASGGVDATGVELVDLGEERRGVDHDPVADDAGNARVQYAGGNQVQDELVAVDDHGVTGVVPSLRTGDDGEGRAEQVHDLALALVSPLRSKDGEVTCCGHRHPAKRPMIAEGCP